MAEESRRAAQRWWWRIYHTCISHTINTLWSNKKKSKCWLNDIWKPATKHLEGRSSFFHTPLGCSSDQTCCHDNEAVWYGNYGDATCFLAGACLCIFAWQVVWLPQKCVRAADESKTLWECLLCVCVVRKASTLSVLHVRVSVKGKCWHCESIREDCC